MITILFSSCEEVEFQGLTDGTNEYLSFNSVKMKLENNTLLFDDHEDFKYVMEGVHDGKFGLEFLEGKFYSMEEGINDIPEEILENITREGVRENYGTLLNVIEDEDELYLKPAIDSRALRTLTNDKGNIVIGDTLYHFSYDKTYLIPYKEYSPETNVKQNFSREIEVIRNFAGSITRDGVHRCKDFYGGSKRKQQRKMQAELWDYNNGIYQEVSVGVENYDKNFAHIWKKDDATWLTMEGDYSVYLQDSYAPGTIHETGTVDENRYHEKEIEIVVVKRYLDGNTIAVLNWNGTDMYFEADESDDSEVPDHVDVTGDCDYPW